MSYWFADSLRAGAFAPARKLSTNLNDINHCRVYSEKTPDDGQKNRPKHVQFHSKNKFEKLLHLVGFITMKFSVYPRVLKASSNLTLKRKLCCSCLCISHQSLMPTVSGKYFRNR
jgi:hypothetical protein